MQEPPCKKARQMSQAKLQFGTSTSYNRVMICMKTKSPCLGMNPLRPWWDENYNAHSHKEASLYGNHLPIAYSLSKFSFWNAVLLCISLYTMAITSLNACHLHWNIIGSQHPAHLPTGTGTRQIHESRREVRGLDRLGFPSTALQTVIATGIRICTNLLGINCIKNRQLVIGWLTCGGRMGFNSNLSIVLVTHGKLVRINTKLDFFAFRTSSITTANMQLCIQCTYSMTGLHQVEMRAGMLGICDCEEQSSALSKLRLVNQWRSFVCNT